MSEYTAVSTIPVAQTDVDSRSQFITRTYTHLLAAMLAFTVLEVFLFDSGMALPMAQAMMKGSWLLVLGGFMIVSWFATRIAHNTQSMALQYLALGGFVVAEAIIFVPLLVMAHSVGGGVIESAAIVTLFGLTGLTAVVFITRKDFSFLRGILMWGGVVALVLIVSGVALLDSSGTMSIPD